MMPTQQPTLYHPLPYLPDSTHYFSRVRHWPWAVFLDSGQHTDHRDSHFDIISAAPFKTMTTRGRKTTVSSDDAQHIHYDDPFTLLQQQLSLSAPCPPLDDWPFCGGAIGLFAYDLGRQFIALPSQETSLEDCPDMQIGFYDWAIVTDHRRQRSALVSQQRHPETLNLWPKLIQQIEQPVISPSVAMTVTGPLHSATDYSAYQKAFHKVKSYIQEGDCYQVNLANRFHIQAEGDPWTAYQQLRQQNPAPFSAFFDTPDISILSSSPERLLRLKNGHVETKPIKGTRPRGINTEHDEAMIEALQHSEKDRAENLMIIDLLRNDLGKVCTAGSIHVPHPFSVESFATVHHLVSTITGQLALPHTAITLLQACFPGGSITGAPKKRAMEIIAELETHRRGAYCGSMAYIGFDGNMDSNILIRTLTYSQQQLRFWSGGGIVADSVLSQEYQETQDKSLAIQRLIEKLRPL